MQTSDWISLLKLIPRKKQNILSVVTNTNLEIAVQDILRMEATYFVMRGRLAGTTDSGRTYFIPYDSLSFIGFRKPMQVEELFSIYGEAPPADVGLSEFDMEEEPKPKEEEPAPVAAEDVAAAPEVPKKPEPARHPAVAAEQKEAMLDRLRARVRGGGGDK